MAQDPAPELGFDPAEVDPAQFAKTVAETPEADLEAGMRSEYRQVVLDTIFERMEEHFDAAKAGDIDAAIDFVILDRPDGGEDRYQVVVRGGTCKVTKEPAESPRVTLKMKPVDFLRLATGNAGGPTLFMTGRLQIEGDLMFAARVADLFRIPTAG